MKPLFFFTVALSLGLLGPIAPTAKAQVTLTWLAAFNGTNGATPESALIQGRDGDFYGAAMQGGLFNFGTIFKVTTNGVYTNLVSFNWTNGAAPQAGLMQDNEGNLWGTTYEGGTNGLGTVFTITTNGVFRSTSFDLANYSPNSVLLQATDGLLYGTTLYGGSSNLGSIFQFTPPGSVRTLAVFDGTNGSYPYDSGLVQGDDGLFYGSTPSGGIGFDSTNIYSGWGTLFKMSTNSPLTNLWKLDGTNGAFPVGVLARGLDGTFYGATSDGGIGFDGTPSSGFGTLFKITTNGSFTTLCYFDNLTNGANPFAGLILATDGNFYGTTTRGGTNHPPNPNNGTIFRMTPGGKLELLV
jgi:uncharacterized repeat protein (TIGR03803 family)